MIERDAVIIGAGFAGLYMLHRLRQRGLSVAVLEAGGDVGGTWYWNRYPGARCDIESLEYSYQFDEALQQEWQWSERYSPQPEILRYIQHVTERFDLRRDIHFDQRVTEAVFEEQSGQWQLRTESGETWGATFLIAATGCLSIPNEPDIPGRERFAGHSYHTGRWPHEAVDFSGQRVGVIGTGSSAIQSIPLIADQAAQLYVFQRHPCYSVPAHNAPLDPDLQQRIKARYADFREENKHTRLGYGARHPGNDGHALEMTAQERREQLEHHWKLGGLLYYRAFGDMLFDAEANETAARFVRDKIREVVDDPQTAEKLCPKEIIFGKRLCADTGYFQTYNRDHVHLVDILEHPIEEITARGIRTDDTEYELDSIVYATGFDAMTGALARIDIRGRGGVALGEHWAQGPRTYLGLQVAGFPNFFTVTGPGSPSVFTNMLPSIEQHVEFIDDCIARMRQRGERLVEPSSEAEQEWVEYLAETAEQTLFPQVDSWYMGANIPGKPRMLMALPGFADYRELCLQIVEDDYRGFRFS